MLNVGQTFFIGKVYGFLKVYERGCDLKKLGNRIELPRTLHAHLCDSSVPTLERTHEKESREKKKAIEGLWAVESLAPASPRSAHTGVGVGIIPGPSSAALDLAERGLGWVRAWHTPPPMSPMQSPKLPARSQLGFQRHKRALCAACQVRRTEPALTRRSPPVSPFPSQAVSWTGSKPVSLSGARDLILL